MRLFSNSAFQRRSGLLALLHQHLPHRLPPERHSLRPRMVRLDQELLGTGDYQSPNTDLPLTLTSFAASRVRARGHGLDLERADRGRRLGCTLISAGGDRKRSARA